MTPALLFALALFAADVETEAAVATATPSAPSTPATGEPATDYEMVAWCYGALGAHMGLYPVAMPEVERIERQWSSSPQAAEENIAGYEDQREAGKAQLALFRKAMEAAEKASIQPIQETGVAAIRKGEAIWTGAKLADPKHLAREWMSWGLPDKCGATAEALQAKASVLGQAISYNAAEAAVAEEAVEVEAEAEAPATIDDVIEDSDAATE